jgi:hypothetical protein
LQIEDCLYLHPEGARNQGRAISTKEKTLVEDSRRFWDVVNNRMEAFAFCSTIQLQSETKANTNQL